MIITFFTDSMLSQAASVITKPPSLLSTLTWRNPCCSTKKVMQPFAAELFNLNLDARLTSTLQRWRSRLDGSNIQIMTTSRLHSKRQHLWHCWVRQMTSLSVVIKDVNKLKRWERILMNVDTFGQLNRNRILSSSKSSDDLRRHIFGAPHNDDDAGDSLYVHQMNWFIFTAT